MGFCKCVSANVEMLKIEEQSTQYISADYIVLATP